MSSDRCGPVAPRFPRRRLRARLLAAGAVVLATASAAIVFPLTAGHAVPAGGWTIVNSPSTGDGGSNILLGSTCANSQECWAVGVDILNISGPEFDQQPHDPGVERHRMAAVGRPQPPERRPLRRDLRRRVGLLGRRSLHHERRAERATGRALGRAVVAGRAHPQRARCIRSHAPRGQLHFLFGLLGRWRDDRRPGQPGGNHRAALERERVVPGSPGPHRAALPAAQLRRLRVPDRLLGSRCRRAPAGEQQLPADRARGSR